MFSSVKELDSSTEYHRNDSNMICIYHIRPNKLIGNLRTSANPYILS